MLEVIVDASGETVAIRRTFFRFTEGIKRFEKEGEIVCVQGVKKNSKYMCQRCGNVDRRLFASFLCKRCSKVCAYCRKCITMGRVSECAVLVRGIAERKREKNSNLLQWNGTLSTGQNLAAQGVIEAIKQKESFLFGLYAGLGKQRCCFTELTKRFKKEKEFVSQRRERMLFWN